MARQPAQCLAFFHLPNKADGKHQLRSFTSSNLFSFWTGACLTLGRSKKLLMLINSHLPFFPQFQVSFNSLFKASSPTILRWGILFRAGLEQVSITHRTVDLFLLLHVRVSFLSLFFRQCGTRACQKINEIIIWHLKPSACLYWLLPFLLLFLFSFWAWTVSSLVWCAMPSKCCLPASSLYPRSDGVPTAHVSWEDCAARGFGRETQKLFTSVVCS